VITTEPTNFQKSTTEEQPQKDEGFFNNLPPPPFDPRVPCPVPFVIGGPPNCQCLEKGRCTLERMESTKLLLPKTDLVCGFEYEPCCYEDSPYPGIEDDYVIKCVPQESCVRRYGEGPTDIAEFGNFPPCPGYGAVRCLDHLGVGPFIPPHFEVSPPPPPPPALPVFPVVFSSSPTIF